MPFAESRSKTLHIPRATESSQRRYHLEGTCILAIIGKIASAAQRPRRGIGGEAIRALFDGWPHDHLQT